MGLEALTIKEFKKFKNTIDFLAKFGLTIDDLVELKMLKEQLNNANLTSCFSKKEEVAKEQEKRNKIDVEKKKSEGFVEPSKIIQLFADGEKEGFYPNGRRG